MRVPVAMTALTLAIAEGRTVSAVLDRPADPKAGFAFAHGAGAGMHHAFMAAFAEGLVARGVATLRYQFPWIEEGRGRVDPPPVAHATVRAAVAALRAACPGLPLFAGGKSFGGRMTSQAEAVSTLAMHGLVFVGFPLHPSDKPSQERAKHLFDTGVPLLFLQGTRDALAEESAMQDLLQKLGPRATVRWLPDADHAFHVRKKSGWNDDDVLATMLDTTVSWMSAVLSA